MRPSFTTWLLGISSAIVAANCGGTNSPSGATTSESPLTSVQTPNGPGGGSSGGIVSASSSGAPIPDGGGEQPYPTTFCIAIPGATDCFCPSGTVAMAGGAGSGSASNWLNASQAGPSFGGSSQEWRVSCVDPSTGNRTQCSQPFVVCPEITPHDIRIETSQCTTTRFSSDCTCKVGETAVSGGAYAGGVSNALNASQAGPSYGASPQTWRTSCVDSTGVRVACEQPYAVCVAFVPFTISTQCIQQSDLSWDCDCGAGGLAVSGGAYAGPLAMLNANEAGPQVNFGKEWWHVSCVDSKGASVACEQPFAVCSSF